MILGLEPVTFWCVVLTISAQIVLLIIWGLVWEGEE